MVSLALFLAAFGPLSTRYGFPSGNSSTAPIDAPATVTPVSCEDALFPPPHRAGLWTLGLWILSTPNAEETQSSFPIGFVDSRCGHVSSVSSSGAFSPGAFLPHHATSTCRCHLEAWAFLPHHATSGCRCRLEAVAALVPIPEGTAARSGSVSCTALGRETAAVVSFPRVVRSNPSSDDYCAFYGLASGMARHESSTAFRDRQMHYFASYGLASGMALLESSTAFSGRQMHGAGPTLEAAARPPGSEDPYLAACRRILLETIGVGLYFAMRRGRRRAHGMRLCHGALYILVRDIVPCMGN